MPGEVERIHITALYLHIGTRVYLIPTPQGVVLTHFYCVLAPSLFCFLFTELKPCRTVTVQVKLTCKCAFLKVKYCSVEPWVCGMTSITASLLFISIQFSTKKKDCQTADPVIERAWYFDNITNYLL